MLKTALKRGWVFAIILVISYHFLWASDNTVVSVNVLGNNEISTTLIKSASTLTEGEKLSVGNMEAAIKNLYKTGMFEDVRIRAEKAPGGLDVFITVKEYPRLQKLEFIGNDEFKDKKLLEVTDIDSFEFVSPQKVKNGVNSIKDLYKEKGFANADVSTEAFESSSKRLILRFNIDEGDRVKVRKISFDGNQAFDDRKLRGKMDTHQKSLFRSGEFNEDTYEEDKTKILDYYKEKGYITVEITRDTIWYDETGENMYIRLFINEGVQYRFGKVNVEGNTILATDKITDAITFDENDIFSSSKYDESIANVYFIYQEEGYIFTQILDDKILEDGIVTVNLKIFEGDQAKINRMKITGNTRTFEKVIRREFALYPGEVFKRSKLMRTQRNVYYLNYFEDVKPDFKVLDDGTVDIIMEVVEKPVGRFQVGAGYNNQDYLVGNISIGWPNVLGRGWESEFTWEFGKRKQNISFSFTEPWFLDTPTTVGMDLYNSLWKWSNYYTEQRRGGALRLGRRLTFPDDFFSIYARYRLEEVSYFDFDDSYTPSYAYDLREIEWPKLRSALKMTITRDSRDSRLFANKGNMNSYSIEFAGNLLGGDEDFQKQEIRSNWYFQIWKYLVFVVKGNFSFLTNWLGDPDDVPFGERFFPGGISYDGQIRGYDDREISPIDYSEEVYDSSVTPDVTGTYPLDTPSYPFRIGGRSVLVLSSEFRVPITKDQLYFSVFSDIGNCWLRPSDLTLNPDKLYKSAGVGARLVAPMIGIIGFDAAYGFDDLDGDGNPERWNFHFQIGPEF
ncbi:outer membrane protein assembly factor BamA [bacterium]|nr:outer membrane protein assembly factor BamA [bacterium]